jgi:RNA polymerase sigma-70 factor, ECF subfamily
MALPEPQGNTDETLVERSTQGDAAAFGELYERYMEQIFRYLYYQTADKHEAEDLTETVFLKAWQALPRTRKPIANIRAWLYRLAHNLVIDRRRTRKKLATIEDYPYLSDPAVSPEQALQSKEASQALAVLLTKLKPRSRQVLICRFINDLSHRETAEIMGLKENHVRVLQYRALQEMRRRMEKDASSL